MPSGVWARWARTLIRVPVIILAFLVRLYQAMVSPLLPPACRFEPTCSDYMRSALLAHGLFRGLWLGMRRLLRCHPGHPGGYDPVPERKSR